MAGLDPAIHDFSFSPRTWMPGTSSAKTRFCPGMTEAILKLGMKSDDFFFAQQARSAVGPSATMSGCRASDTAGDSRITSACAPKMMAAR
jgi:hypothetical protein